MNKEAFQQVRIGQIVYCIDGPGQAPQPGSCSHVGIVIRKVESAWGFHAEVKLDDNTEETVDSFRKMNEKGIGFYLSDECRSGLSNILSFPKPVK